MDTSEQRYQRDVARLEAHRLALKDDEFRRISDLVRQEAREHARFVQQRGAAVVLNDRDPHALCVSSADGKQVVTIAFNAVRHQVEIKNGLHYLCQVDIDSHGKPIVTGKKWGQPLGIVTDDMLIDAVRHAINKITDLPLPLA
jgi:hypothetical protein